MIFINDLIKFQAMLVLLRTCCHLMMTRCEWERLINAERINIWFTTRTQMFTWMVEHSECSWCRAEEYRGETLLLCWRHRLIQQLSGEHGVRWRRGSCCTSRTFPLLCFTPHAALQQNKRETYNKDNPTLTRPAVTHRSGRASRINNRISRTCWQSHAQHPIITMGLPL